MPVVIKEMHIRTVVEKRIVTEVEGQAVRELERVERICTLPSGNPLL